MEENTVIESLMYRCEKLGDDITAFVIRYSSRENLLGGAASTDPDEAMVARALLVVKDAHETFERVWAPICAEHWRRRSFKGLEVPPVCPSADHEWTASHDVEFGYIGSSVWCSRCHAMAEPSVRDFVISELRKAVRVTISGSAIPR